MATLKPYRRKFNDAPKWITSRVERWLDFFSLREWTVGVSMLSADLMEASETVSGGTGPTQAYTSTNVPYNNAELAFSKTLHNNDFGRAIVFHEVRHIYYDKAFTQWVVDHIIDRYAPEDVKMHLCKELFNRVESLIETDVHQFEQLTSM